MKYGIAHFFFHSIGISYSNCYFVVLIVVSNRLNVYFFIAKIFSKYIANSYPECPHISSKSFSAMISGLCYWHCGHSYTYDFVDVCIKCCMTVKPQKCEVNLPSYSFCFCFTYLTSIAFYNRPSTLFTTAASCQWKIYNANK